MSGCRLLVVLLALIACGCGSIPLDAAPPAGFDLNGHWVLDSKQKDVPPRRDGQFLGQDFPLLVSEEMTIEQDARSMGIEYEGGGYRDVTWGERRRGVWEVRAGWHEGDLHIYSKAPDTSAVEVWHLSNDGEQLDIDIRVKGPRDQSFRRVFRRSDAI